MLRCSQCGAEFSEWAARCPSCRKPADAVAMPTSGAPATEPGGHPGAPPGAPPARRAGPDAVTEDRRLPKPEQVPSLPIPQLPGGIPSAPDEPEGVTRQLPSFTFAAAGPPPAAPANGNG